ncbi:MAG: MBL fold metallo-hydrolase [Desulfobacter sp.]|nr:MBL fold metallo-hydrolase [Desulfobacter sp.]WDP83753.1 MAG: MBL fold metallo-hydrolase [Desulfobacter sp.]
MIESPNYKIFFSGDSGYFQGFALIGEQFGPFDMTFLECGAYNPAWHGVHMYPEETVKAHEDLKGKILHPIHWGTFNLSLHSWYEPMIRLKSSAESANIPIATPVAGQTIDLKHLGSPWWGTRLP